MVGDTYGIIKIKNLFYLILNLEDNELRTLKDLEDMKFKKTRPFENAYEYFIENLVNDYVSKFDGVNRIKAELSEWDTEAQQVIIQEVSIRVKGLGLQDFEL